MRKFYADDDPEELAPDAGMQTFRISTHGHGSISEVHGVRALRDHILNLLSEFPPTEYGDNDYE